MTDRLIALDLDATLIDDNERLIPGVTEYLPRIQHELGYRFTVVTARQWSHPERRRNGSVERILHAMQTRLGISIDGYICTNGQPKGYYAGNLGASYLVDDQLRLLDGCWENRVVPIWFAPPNDARVPAMACIMCHTWHQIYTYLSAL